MTSTLKKIIKQTIKQMLREAPSDKKKERPVAMGDKGPRGLPPFASWGGRIVYSKESGEPFDVLSFTPDDSSEEVERVSLKSRDSGKRYAVSYDKFLSDYVRHSGQPVRTELGDTPAPVAAWAYHELKAKKDKGERLARQPIGKEPIATFAPGPIDVDDETGEWVRKPSSIALDNATPALFQDEVAMDKLDLVVNNFDMYNKLVEPYIDKYKEGLKKSMVIAKKAIFEYCKDMYLSDQVEAEIIKQIEKMVADGKIDPDEADSAIAAAAEREGLGPEDKEWFRSTPGNVIARHVWELPNFHEHIVPSLGIPGVHISTISSICTATGIFDIKLVDDDPDVEEAIKTDPGFVTYISRADHGKVWNDLRRHAEKQGKYRGQF